MHSEQEQRKEDQNSREWAEAFYRAILDSARNACKFTPEKGVISVRSGNRTANTITIEITDNGVGIEPQFLERIFDAFEQVHSRREGLGLGLAISKSILEMHGGTIRAQSEGTSKGATFIIDLPLSRAD